MQRRTDMRKEMMQFHPPSCHADAGGNYLIAPIVSTFAESHPSDAAKMPIILMKASTQTPDRMWATISMPSSSFLLASGSIPTEDLDPLPVKRRYLRRL